MKKAALNLPALALLASLSGCATLDKWALEAEMKRRAADNVGEKITASPSRLKRAAEKGMSMNDYDPSTVSTKSGPDGKGYQVTGVYRGSSGRDVGNAFLNALSRDSSKDTEAHKYSRSEKAIRYAINGAWNKDLSKAEPGKSVMRVTTLEYDVDTKGAFYNVEETDDLRVIRKVREDFDMYMKMHPEGAE